MDRRNSYLAVGAVVLASIIAIAAAPPQGRSASADKPSPSDAESNERIVADFLARKDRAEKAQRAILADLRGVLDRKRAEFETAHKKYDDARARFADIVGPLPRQGVMDPADPRMPYEFEVQRLGPESSANAAAYRRLSPAQGAPIRP